MRSYRFDRYMHDPIRMTWREYLRGECLWRGKRIRMGDLQVEILAALLLHRGRPISNKELVELVYPLGYGEPSFSTDNVRQAIQRLRYLMPGLIQTAAGRGWGWFIAIPEPVVCDEAA